MNEKAFIDTNIFIYLYSEDEVKKQHISQKAVDKYDCIISTQVLNEFSNVCIGKLNQQNFIKSYVSASSITDIFYVTKKEQ